MSQIAAILPNTQLTLRMGESRQHGRREASNLLPPAATPQPAARLIVTPETGGKISKNGQAHLHAVAVDANGQVVTGVNVGFASSAPTTVAVAEVTTDARDDVTRALLTSFAVVASANITVSAPGLPSVIVPFAVQATAYGSAAGGKPVGLWMSAPERSAAAAAQYAFDRGHTGILHEVELGAAARWYFLALLQQCQLLGLKLIAQFFPGSRGVLGPDGQFSVAAWQATFAAFPAATILPFVGGTLIAHQLLGYPKGFPSAPRWGRVITPAELKTMAATSKAALPTLPVLVGGEPIRDIGGSGYSPADVDYAFPMFSYGKGPSLAKCRDWLDRMAVDSAAAGLGPGFHCGMDVGDGGSGSPASDPPGWKVQGVGQPSRFAMSPAEISGYGAVLGSHPSVLSILSDSYEVPAESRFFARDDVRAAIVGLAGVYARTGAGDPVAALAVEGFLRVGDRVLLDTSGSGAPEGAPWVRFIDPGDGSPIYGPLPEGAPDPFHTYGTNSFATPDGFAVRVWVVRQDTGQAAFAESLVTVEDRPAVTGGLYTDLGPTPALVVPTPARYHAYLSLHGHKVYYLTDGYTLGAHQTALALTSDRLFFVQDDIPKFADVSFQIDKAALVNTRQAFVSAHGGRADSGVWSRTGRNPFYTLASGASGKVLSLDCDTLAAAVEKDVFADARFQAAFGTADRALSHLRASGLEGLGNGFAATVIVHSSSVPVGVVVWRWTDIAGNAIDDLFCYKPPNACAEIIPEDVRLDYFARTLKVGLRRPMAGDCPAENDRSWQSVNLETGAVGEWLRDGAAPTGDDIWDNVTYSADGEGAKRHQLFPPQTPGEVLFSLPEGNDYMEGTVSSERVWGEGAGPLALGYTLGHGGLVGPWESWGPDVYRTLWANELDDKPYRGNPEVVRRGADALVQAATLGGLETDRWFFDATYLYVCLPAGTTPQVSGAAELQAFDWRMGTEEIFLVDLATGSLIGRLCHHHHRRRTADPGRSLAAAASYDGQFVTFTTNAGGLPATRIYAVCLEPGAGYIPNTPPP